MIMTLHNHNCRTFQKTWNGVNPSDFCSDMGFRYMPSSKSRTNRLPTGAVRQYPSSPKITGMTKGKGTPFTNFTPHKQTIPTFLRSWQLSCLIKWDVGCIKWICLYNRCPFQILVYWPWKLLYRPCKDNHWVRTTRSKKVSNYTSVLGLYSQNGHTSYHKISWNLEATRLNVMRESVKTTSIWWSFRSEILQVTRQSCIEGAFKLHNDRKVFIRFSRIRGFTSLIVFEVRTSMNNYIQQKIMAVITYSCPHISQPFLVKYDPEFHYLDISIHNVDQHVITHQWDMCCQTCNLAHIWSAVIPITLNGLECVMNYTCQYLGANKWIFYLARY